MKTITKDQMIGALEEARDERGSNFVYTEHYDQEGTCQYVAYDEDGNEGAACIAGNALHRLGLVARSVEGDRGDGVAVAE